MSSTESYSGDVTLTGDEQTPIEIDGADNVHVLSGSIDGNLKVVNAEYVFTNTETGGEVDLDGIETEISGALEDGYVMPDGATGDVVIRDAGDVFIEHNAVSGELQVVGSERVFDDSDAGTPTAREEYDETVTGWERSLHSSDPSTGVGVAGGRCSVEIEELTREIDLYVTGWKNSVDIEGNRGTVNLHLAGSHNTIEVAPYVDLNVATDTGVENTVTERTIPHEDIIQTTKSEAYPSFGRAKVTYQEPAPDQNHCPSCGADAATVIERHQEDAFFLFGLPMYTFDEGGASYECEECSRNVGPDVSLSESERKNILG
ncbi:hypothetical protein [Haladaptatus cibarius]|uniref:hypothetical protein n=1 Tax=Haladaptatus cibarius TaxID=453847 RepID=UPI00067846C1|nr:hypothetical protein [Haladaptatus cibarius]